MNTLGDLSLKEFLLIPMRRQYKFNGDNPYTLMKDFLPKEIIELFDIKEIEQKDIILKNKLFNYKNKR